jgi:hypothetical protein
MKVKIGRNARMLCPVCCDVKAARQGNDNDAVYLDCSHSRTPHLLPARGVSLEDIVSNTAQAARLFPLILDGVGIVEQERRRAA